MKPKKQPKKRSKQYETKVKIYGTFDEAMKALIVEEPKPTK